MKPSEASWFCVLSPFFISTSLPLPLPKSLSPSFSLSLNMCMQVSFEPGSTLFCLGDSLTWLGWLTSKLQGSACLFLSQYLCYRCILPHMFTWVLGFESRSSKSWDSTLPTQTSSPTLVLLFSFVFQITLQSLIKFYMRVCFRL